MGAERFEDRVIPVEIEPTDDAPWVLSQLQWVKGRADEAGKRILDILARTHHHDDEDVTAS